MILTIPWSLTLARAARLRPTHRRALMFATLFLAGLLFWTFEVFITVARLDKSVFCAHPDADDAATGTGHPFGNRLRYH